MTEPLGECEAEPCYELATTIREGRKLCEFHNEHKCAEAGCWRYTARGVILCHGHMYGFPEKMNLKPTEQERLRMESRGGRE